MPNPLEKVFNDPIHGCFSLPSYCVQVIDTPEFQRMRYIKQLQTTDHVYPGATHTRFTHSIGVCYLAGQVIRHLQKQKDQPELEISEDDVKCVMLAGLCHDLGHGPLSHYFTEILQRLGINKKHEDISALVLDYLKTKNKIDLNKDQIALISDLISGSNMDQRDPKRRFLYQIVANEENGVDVDKWDYFPRDSYYLGMGQSFDHIRIIKDEMRVCKCKRINKTDEESETLEISFRDKLLSTELSDMFNVRWDLTQRAYQHETHLIIDEMYATAIVDYLKSAESRYGSVKDIVKDIAKDNKKFLEWFLQLDDRVTEEIEFSNVESAKKILERIRKRDLYVKLGEIRDTEIHKTDDERKKFDDDIGSELRKAEKLEDVCKEENLVIIRAKHKYGNCTNKDPQDPLKHIYVFSKDDDQHAVLHNGPMKINPLIPPKYRIDHVLVYTRVPRAELPMDVKQLQQLVEQQLIKQQLLKSPPPTGHVSESAGAIPESKGKVVKDPIHGDISLPLYCWKVIDTPEFQRLRNIRQLGMTEYVYPGATHTRFEHSIGVCHLAGQVINQLRDKHSEISDKDVMCVQLAGLCQDIGHMPLSHEFSNVVKRLDQGPWKRTEVSIKIVRRMLGSLKDSIGLEDEDINLICKLIKGDPEDETRLYLFQIVENKKYGVDVNKWDYIARDSYYCGVSTSFEMKRVLPFMEVRKVDKKEEICYRRSVLKDLNRMFNSMVELKERVYEHRVVKLIESMFADALYLYLKADAEKGREKFLRLDDRIFGLIESSDCEEAKQILQRIHQQRNLYRCLDEVHVWDTRTLDGSTNDECGSTSDERTNDQCGSSIDGITNDPGTLKIMIEVEKGQKHSAFQSFLATHKLKLVIINHKYDFQIYENPCYFYEKKQEGSTQEDSSEIVEVKQADRREFPKLSSKVWEQDLRLYSKADKEKGKSMTFSNLLDDWEQYKGNLTPEPQRHAVNIPPDTTSTTSTKQGKERKLDPIRLTYDK